MTNVSIMYVLLEQFTSFFIAIVGFVFLTDFIYTIETGKLLSQVQELSMVEVVTSIHFVIIQNIIQD